MKKKITVPGNHTLMPYIVEILQNNNGRLSYVEVVYLVLFKFKLPLKYVRKAANETSFAGSYLKRMNVMNPNEKKGIWSLNPEYMNLTFDEAKKITYEKYKSLGKK